MFSFVMFTEIDFCPIHQVRFFQGGNVTVWYICTLIIYICYMAHLQECLSLFSLLLFFFIEETCLDLSKFGTCIQHLQRCLFFHPVFTKETCTDLPSKFGTCMQHLPRGLFFQPVSTEGTCTDLSSTFGTCMQHISRGLFFHPVFTEETAWTYHGLTIYIWYM